MKMTSYCLFLVTLPLTIVSCDILKKTESAPAANFGPPVVEYVTKDTYLNGDAFCARYNSITSKESGIRVTVPVDYKDSSKGSTRIYAFTNKPFDPKKASVVFIDGGPGQNTHGIPDVFGESYNEIHIDQRGLGCSAPQDYEMYLDPKLYSTLNTVHDTEAVRKAYGIEKWSVFGVSYGTVPATVYASLYPKSTTSAILEGVAFSGKTLHQWDYKVQKLNLVLDTLSPAQRKTFTKIVIERDTNYAKIFIMLQDFFYMNRGMTKASELLKQFISFDGVIQQDRIDTAFKRWSDYQGGDHPQRPMAVDGRVLTVIYCKELQARAKDKSTIDYDIAKNEFVEKSSESNSFASTCDKFGVPKSDDKPYVASQYPVFVPVYYFQGSHDGATLARGAIEHWKKVPKRKSYFFLNQKGGHNPSLSAAVSKETSEKEGQRQLYDLAIQGQPITRDIVEQVNISKKEGKWSFYPELPLDTSIVEKDLDGIRFH